jgi:bacteriophage N4 adsorption protein B
MDVLIIKFANILVSLYTPFYILALIVGSVFVISGFTDLFFDLYSIGWKLRRLLIGGDWPTLTLERLEAREQQRIAIFIAAWHEADVITQTLTNATETIRYKNYDIFVGTYPNDPDTQREVDKVASINPHVHKVVTPEDGPTNKASNLNHVFQSLLKYESDQNTFYDIIVMHDSEDVIHPYSLLVYNYLIPRKEMLQIPVFPMALPLKNVTHWTYADEFAENHTKILYIREISGGFVPSAGVGTAFTKRAFQLLALEHEEVFSPNSLTEDYQLGLRMNLHGMKAAFVQVKIPTPQSVQTGKRRASDWVATRAVFPTDFKRAVKQKTRWNIGIVLQGWENIGWEGSLTVKWNLFQDRKALVAAPVNFLAYFVFIYFLVYSLVNRFTLSPMPVLIPNGSYLSILVIISTIFMIWRSLNRAFAVNLIYGFWPAVTSIPRAVWGNIINFFAITRAVIQYMVNKFRKREVAWDKTSHEFPIGVTEEGRAAKEGMHDSENNLGDYVNKLKINNIIRLFNQRMEAANEREKIELLESIPRDHGEILFPHFIRYIHDPSWEIRAAVCRALSYLRLKQGIPHLKKAAGDPDWIVRSNAVRALGKLGDGGERALLNLLYSEDRYTRDAARTILEQQGFLDRHLQELHSKDPAEIHQALNFFKILAFAGESELARQIIEAFRPSRILK